MTTPPTLPRPTPNPDPPPLPALDAEAFRRELAGLASPTLPLNAPASRDVKDTLSRFCSILASLYGDELDRLSLWTRIDSAIESACAKCDDDMELWASLCLGHVKADAGRAAACAPLVQTLEVMASRPAEWRAEFLRYARTCRYAAVAFGRARWERVKSGGADL